MTALSPAIRRRPRPRSARRCAAETTPLRLPLGGDAVDAILTHLDTVREELVAWEKVSRGTDFDGT